MAEHRGLEPLPVTVDLVGSLFKAAKYRSSAQYFAVAKCKHIEAGFQWTQQLDLARSQAIRSIQRGMGPSSPKLDLFFDNVKVGLCGVPRLRLRRARVAAHRSRQGTVRHRAHGSVVPPTRDRDCQRGGQ